MAEIVFNAQNDLRLSGEQLPLAGSVRQKGGLDRAHRAVLLRAHYQLQQGRFFSETTSSRSRIIASSRVSAAPMWNHGAWIEGDPAEFEQFVRQMSGSPNRERRPTLYVVSEPETEPLTRILQQHGFECFDRESWMLWRDRITAGDRSDSGEAGPLKIIQVESEPEAEDLIRVFCAAYRTREPGYALSLKQQALDPECRRGLAHFVGYVDNAPVCVATLAENEDSACIYNMGTIPEARKRGYGRTMMQHIIGVSRARGHRDLFLQVDSGGKVEGLYQQLGFVTEFTRTGWRLKNWTAAPVELDSNRSTSAWHTDPAPNARLLDSRADATITPDDSIVRSEFNFDPQLTLEKCFEAAVEQHPDSPALLLDEPRGGSAEQLNYAELNRRANRIARHLRSMGVGPETLVGLCIERTPQLVIAMLGVLKAGGACVPIDASLPEARIRFILEDTAASVLLTQRTLRDRLPPRSGTRVVCIDSDPDLEAQTDDSNLPPAAHGSNLAYVIYTSGSTGAPKGVLITHAAIANHCRDMQEFYALSADDRVLQFSSLSFDAAWEQVFAALFSGSMLVMRGEDVWSTTDFAGQLARLRLTVADIPVGYWNQLAQQWSAHPESVPENRLRLLILGGEALPPETLNLWRKTPLRHVRMINAYGPTESTVTATAFDVESVGPDLPRRIPIGQPRGGRAVYILDTHGKPVAVGTPGELCIGGPMLARGYLNRPDLTQARFVPDPFNSASAARMYRTGDLARVLRNGTIEFLGRTDDQVKIRGFRVELGEIENALLQHPEIKEAAVVARGNGTSEKQLIAYFTLKNGEPLEDIRSFLKRTLPDYMVPAEILKLGQLPLTAGGKVDRGALPDPEIVRARSKSNKDVKGPGDPLELQIQLIFERVLNKRPVSVDANFFELGGDSLQALELIVQLERATGKSMPLGTLYQSSTVETVARAVQEQDGTTGWSALVPLQTSGSRLPFYLIHTTPGDVLGYGSLVYHLGTEQPCYGFQSLGLNRAELSHTRVEQMVDYYLGLLREFQPHGPYCLGGWCYGGMIAVDMARKLREDGEEVALLALLETVAVPPGIRSYRYYLHRFGCLLRMNPACWMRYVRAKISYHRAAKVANQMRFRQVTQSPHESPEARQQREARLAQLEHVYRTNLHALRSYRSRPYSGRVTLFNAADTDPAVIQDAHYGWVGLANEIEVHVVPGDHDTMLAEPHVAVLARALSKCLDRVNAANSRRSVRSPQP